MSNLALHLCRCECHTSGGAMKHCMQCCSQCSYCGSNVVVGWHDTHLQSCRHAQDAMARDEEAEADE